MKRKILPLCIRAAGFLLSAMLMMWHYSEPMRTIRDLPEEIHIVSDETHIPLPINGVPRWLTSGIADVAVSKSTDERLYSVTNTLEHDIITYRLWNVIPLRTVSVVQAEEVQLIPGGFAIGITIRTQGVLIVGIGTVDTLQGALSPGVTADLRAGDVILAVDGNAVQNSGHLSKLTNDASGSVRLTIRREGETFERNLQPVVDATDQVKRIGLWVRDSTAGIGTTSFYDDTLGWFCALGHPVSDIDTQSLLSIREGRILPTQIVDVRKGEQGVPGELIGEFSVSEKSAGSILVNSEYGIYGTVEHVPENPLYGRIPMGYAFEAHTGPALMLATVSDEGVQAFACEIVRVNTQTNAAVKGMIIDIDDESLMSETGGIVQGMSGCPVIQDGKLVGVVTHVFVNDPTRGYCVYAEWMYEQMLEAASAS